MYISSKRDKKNFINEYVKSLNNERAALFAGAGLSIPSEGVNWKELLRRDASSIGINVDRESDLISVAQYIFNESRSRQTITSLIKNKISKKGDININHRLISTLPIKKVWTTNYDEFLEKAFSNSEKIVDIKRTVQDMATERDDANVTVYKMHGDIGIPNSTVLLKDDYEIYDRKNELFINALKNDLLSNTFLFIGFSFDDPNLESILSKVRIMLEGNPRIHYCILKNVKIDDEVFSHLSKEEKHAEYKYQQNKQQLKITDLMRYGIKAILVDTYEEITDILKAIKYKYLSNKIFISGAYEEVDSFLCFKGDKAQSKADEFCEKLGKALYMEDFYVSSGFGLGVGRSIITGYLTQEALQGNTRLSSKLIIRPFPIQNEPFEKSLYREKILTECGISIFVFGNRCENGEIEHSPGVTEEYMISRKLNHFIIPIGVTKYAAQEIWKKQRMLISENVENEKIRDYFLMLNDENQEIEEIINIVILLIKEYQNHTEQYVKLIEVND